MEAFWRAGPGYRILLCRGSAPTDFNGPQSNYLQFCIGMPDATSTGLVTSIGIRSASTAAGGRAKMTQNCSYRLPRMEVRSYPGGHVIQFTGIRVHL